jgi:hypothetical protein
MWSSGQGSWLQFQTSEFDSRRYQIFCVVVILERGPLKSYLKEKVAASVWKPENTGVGDPTR